MRILYTYSGAQDEEDRIEAGAKLARDKKRRSIEVEVDTEVRKEAKGAESKKWLDARDKGTIA